MRPLQGKLLMTKPMTSSAKICVLENLPPDGSTTYVEVPHFVDDGDPDSPNLVTGFISIQEFNDALSANEGELPLAMAAE